MQLQVRGWSSGSVQVTLLLMPPVCYSHPSTLVQRELQAGQIVSYIQHTPTTQRNQTSRTSSTRSILPFHLIVLLITNLLLRYSLFQRQRSPLGLLRPCCGCPLASRRFRIPVTCGRESWGGGLLNQKVCLKECTDTIPLARTGWSGSFGGL